MEAVSVDSGHGSMAHLSDMNNGMACPVNQVFDVNTNSGMDVPSSQTINSSSQNIMAHLDKKFAFYKCDNITTNFK